MIDFKSDINSIEMMFDEISGSLRMQCSADLYQKCKANINELRKMNDDASHIYNEIKSINEMMCELYEFINEDPEQTSGDSYSRFGFSTYSDSDYSEQKRR